MLSNSYKSLYINNFMTFLIFFVAANNILANYGVNGLHEIDTMIGFNISDIIYIITGVSIILLTFKKYTWLPFLGETVLPSSIIPVTKNTGDTTISIKVKPNTKIAYWSSLPSTDNKIDVEKAYDNFSNAGVNMSDENGNVTLTFNKGTGYVVPGGRFIKPHVHYRQLNNKFGMIGPVKTIYL